MYSRSNPRNPLVRTGAYRSLGRLWRFPQSEGRRGLPALPVELHRIIIDHVMSYHPRADILACALTCSYWLSLCERYLFKIIAWATFDDAVRCTSEIQLYGQKSLLSHNTTEVCLNFSCDLSQHRAVLKMLSTAFRSLRGIHWFPAVFPFSPAPTHPPGNHNILSAKSLYRDYSASAFRYLRRLELYKHVFHSFTDLLRICTSLPKLTFLRLIGVTWQHVPHTVPPCPWIAKHWLLREMEVYECPDIWPLLWLWTWAGGDTRTSAAMPPMARGRLYGYAQSLGPLYDMAVTYPTIVVIRCDLILTEQSLRPWNKSGALDILSIIFYTDDPPDAWKRWRTAIDANGRTMCARQQDVAAEEFEYVFVEHEDDLYINERGYLLVDEEKARRNGHKLDPYSDPRDHGPPQPWQIRSVQLVHPEPDEFDRYTGMRAIIKVGENPEKDDFGTHPMYMRYDEHEAFTSPACGVEDVVKAMMLFKDLKEECEVKKKYGYANYDDEIRSNEEPKWLKQLFRVVDSIPDDEKGG